MYTNNLTTQKGFSREETPEENLSGYHKYYLLKNNNAYKFKVIKLKNEILIACNDYKIKLDNEDLSVLTSTKLRTLDEAYIYIINLFEQNKANLKDISINKKIRLELNIGNQIEIVLLYNRDNKDSMSNSNFNELKNDINYLKEEINKIKMQIKIPNENAQTSNNNNTTPNKELINIVNDSYSYKDWMDNTFTIFKSIDNILCLVYTNINKSLIFFDVNRNTILNDIKKAHNEYITNIKHYLDNINNRDLILTVSFDENNLKVWNFPKNEILCSFKNIHKTKTLVSACILNEKMVNYIITPGTPYDSIKILTLKSEAKGKINDSYENTNFIEPYYDNKSSKNYIITGNEGYVKSYDFNEKKMYRKYDDNSGNDHNSLFIDNYENIVRLVESCWDGNIRIWNFHTGKLLKKVKINDDSINSICLWNDDYLFVGCSDKKIKLIDLYKGKIIKELEGHKNNVVSIKKINHPQYGECLISQGANKDPILLWRIKL